MKMKLPLEDVRLLASNILEGQLERYQREMFREDMIERIRQKKGEMIRNAKTKEEIVEILFPKAPYFNGADWVCDEHLLPEEELIAWSRASLTAPLDQIATNRALYLAHLMYPNEFQLEKETGLMPEKEGVL